MPTCTCFDEDTFFIDEQDCLWVADSVTAISSAPLPMDTSVASKKEPEDILKGKSSSAGESKIEHKSRHVHFDDHPYQKLASVRKWSLCLTSTRTIDTKCRTIEHHLQMREGEDRRHLLYGTRTSAPEFRCSKCCKTHRSEGKYRPSDGILQPKMNNRLTGEFAHQYASSANSTALRTSVASTSSLISALSMSSNSATVFQGLTSRRQHCTFLQDDKPIQGRYSTQSFARRSANRYDMRHQNAELRGHRETQDACSRSTYHDTKRTYKGGSKQREKSLKPGLDLIKAWLCR